MTLAKEKLTRGPRGIEKLSSFFLIDPWIQDSSAASQHVVSGTISIYILWDASKHICYLVQILVCVADDYELARSLFVNYASARRISLMPISLRGLSPENNLLVDLFNPSATGANFKRK